MKLFICCLITLFLTSCYYEVPVISEPYHNRVYPRYNRVYPRYDRVHPRHDRIYRY